MPIPPYPAEWLAWRSLLMCLFAPVAATAADADAATCRARWPSGRIRS